MPLKSFPLKTSRSFIVSMFFAFSLSHCATGPRVTDEQTQVKTEAEAPAATDSSNTMHIVNHTKSYLDNILFKPCGAPVKSYTTLTSSLGPQEKVVLNVHAVCIDVIAEDAFEKAVFEQSDISVARPLTLEIK